MAQYTQINPDALVTALTPINNSLGGKQDKTDNTLATTDKTISGAINEINTKVGNLTGALTWKGKFDTLPAVTNYEAGNVVGVGNKEYVLTVTGSTKAWEELGDEGSYLLKSVAEETYAKKTSIPTVNDPKVSIKMNGAEKGSFTLNQATAGEVDLGTVITAHQDISGKVDKTTLLNTLMVVDLSSHDIAVRKAALDDFKAKWLALGNTDLTGARFIAKGYFNLPSPSVNNVIMTYVENGLVATGYTGIAITSYNSIISAYQVNIALDGTTSFNEIRDSEITEEFRNFAWGEVPTTYLKITDAESTYETKTHAAETLTETLRDYAKSEEIFAMANMATANAITSIKQDLSPVLQEIDLTGTDADRKAKLDKFETDWKALTGASDLSGARFVGLLSNDITTITCLLTFNNSAGQYVGVSANTTDNEVVSKIVVGVDGTIYITPLFSHLEAITISIDNTPESKAANVAAIEAYEDNLEALGFDVTKGYMIPITASGRNGFLSTRSGNYPYAGYVAADSSVSDFYNILILGNGEYYDSKIQSENSSELNTISKKLVPAINEVNTLAKSKGNGTITGVKMNGVSKGTSGVVDLGTVLTAHQDISGKVDKTTLLNTLMVVDLSSTDIAVRKAALDDFKAKWLALGNTDLNGARFIGRFSDTNGNTSIHESGKNLMGEDTLLIYKQISPAFPTGFYGLSYIKDMANTMCGLYQIYVDYDNTNPGNVEITQIRDSETLDLLNRFVYAEVPSTYLKITDAESTYAKKTSIPTVNDPKVSIKMNGAEKGSFTLNQVAAGEVDLGTVLTAHQDISGKQDKLISGTNIKTINGESVLGSGDITISGGASSSAYPEVNHGTGDTTFTLTPNTFHVWDEVTSLTLNFGSGISGVANEYLFQFTSGPTATSLTLPDDIKWANDNVPTIGANMIYQVSVLRGLASVLEFNNAIVFPIIGPTNGNSNEEYAKVYEYFVSTYNLTSASARPSNGVIITETLICNDTNYGGRVLKVSLSLNGSDLLLWTQNAIDRSFVPKINNLGVYSTFYWD